MNLQTQLETLQTHLILVKDAKYTNKLDTIFTRDNVNRLVMKNEEIVNVIDIRVRNGILILKLWFMCGYDSYTKEVTIHEFLQDYEIKEKI